MSGLADVPCTLSLSVLLTLTTTYRPATDLGFLLHKHPEKMQTFALPFGQAHVFYPEASAERCTAALLLKVDPVALTRRAHRARADFALYPYVNDRPYVASSFVSVALARVFGSALNASCKTHPDLALRALPLTATLAALPCRGGEALLKRLFGPLGYDLEVQNVPLDPVLGWGESDLFTVTLRHTLPLAQLLCHLYVLVPVLDDEKHYWVGDEELRKLLEKGEGWLAGHPQREQIVKRYLKHQRSLTRVASEHFATEGLADGHFGSSPDVEGVVAESSDADISDTQNPVAEKPRLKTGTPTPKADSVEAEEPDRGWVSDPKLRVGGGLHSERLEAVFGALKASGAGRVLDLGCGEGKLVTLLLGDAQFSEIVGTDVSLRGLERARRYLRLDEREHVARRVSLLHTSLLLRDPRLLGFDAAALVEVIEHLEPDRLPTFERVLFGYMRPKTLVLSTPNREYNAVWPGLGGGFRHPDHRFEWTRAEFLDWAERVAGAYGYTVSVGGVGPALPPYGQPSQLAVFREA